MAATVSAWSKPGAWALDSEEHEAGLLQHDDNDNDAAADFPSLAVAAAAKPKKKKAQTVSLAQFTAQSYQHQEEPIVLPTAPRQRTADELDRDRNRLGGAFRSYGGDRPHRSSGGGDEASNSRWGSSRVSDEPRRNGSFGSRDSNRELAPSRADEIDNWAAAKKSTVGSGGFENQRRERGGGFFDSQSRADESDSWVSSKNFVPSEGRGERERKVRFGTSGSADSDNWNSRKKVEVNGGSESESGRPRLVLQPRSVAVNVNVSDGSAEGGSGNVAKAKGPNPFGEARPREEVLAEKGQDWKRIDEQLESIKLKEDKKDGFGKRGFGSGNGRVAALPDDRIEMSWRMPQSESDDAPPKSAEKVEDGPSEEIEQL